MSLDDLINVEVNNENQVSYHYNNTTLEFQKVYAGTFAAEPAPTHQVAGPCYYCGRSGATAPRAGLARSCGHAPCPAAPVVVAPAQKQTMRPGVSLGEVSGRINADLSFTPEPLVNYSTKPGPRAIPLTRLSPVQLDDLRKLWSAAGWINNPSNSTECQPCKNWARFRDTLCTVTDEFGDVAAPTPICRWCYAKL